MENGSEMSSSLSFASSNLSSSSSSLSHDPCTSLENLSLNKLSCNLENLLFHSEYDYSDAEIVVEDKPVAVHRCILAARSQFFHQLFSKGVVKEGKPRYLMSELVPFGVVGYEAFSVFLNYLYTGKLRPSPPEVSTCVDLTCNHDACGPAITYALELMYASATFQVKELVLLLQRRLLDFVEKAFVEDVIPILVAAFHCQLNQLLSNCIQRVARSDIDCACLSKELPSEVFSKLKSVRLEIQQDHESSDLEVDAVDEKSIKKIHMALDSDDVELVNRLLSESNITLDKAYALHYAAAYCDPKVVKELLRLGLADLSLRNPRGLTVLHVAARRKEPSLLMALLTEGASVSGTTLDGQTAVAICRRLTRLKDYNKNIEQGQVSHKDRICIGILEREMGNSVSGNVPISSPMNTDDLQRTLDYLEDRVAFARLFFPAEAKLAMEIADASLSSANAGLSASKSMGSSGNLRDVDLNETHTVWTKRLQLQLQKLHKTVETGRRYFPHCSDVLDNFLEDAEMPDSLFLEKGTPEEQKLKKRRFMELKEDVQKAFNKDMENKRSGLARVSSFFIILNFSRSRC
ncbi:BTB/POZ domain and ankyrin repeat-containing protein NPR2-like, partial [Carica papaya]|uniref:BTB/POZ domain and ankyrin repeat-containing protein NPR2-like n=1 Tax=Carica papaya TaxID=3649 RepID=UPI000B8CB3C5